MHAHLWQDVALTGDCCTQAALEQEKTNRVKAYTDYRKSVGIIGQSEDRFCPIPCPDKGTVA